MTDEQALLRAPAFNPAWRTSTVVALARQMRQTHDFAPLPILADALQDADCDAADVLDACRDGSGPWVASLVLGETYRAVMEGRDQDRPRLAFADDLERTAGGMPCPQADCVNGTLRDRWHPEIRHCGTCRGSGRVPDGRRERSEFVRVQVELASFPEHLEQAISIANIFKDNEQFHRTAKRWNPSLTHPNITPEMVSRFQFLRRRERELFEDWKVGGFGPKNLKWTEAIPQHMVDDWNHNPPFALVTRGFVSEITLTADDWLRFNPSLYWHPKQTAACPGCHGCRSRTWTNHVGHNDCSTCSGSGRVPRGDCPATAQPLRRVTWTTMPDRWPFYPTDVRGPEATLALAAELWPGLEIVLPGN